ncbi:MAG: hypothetical protein RR807_08120, partial [Oscillospiraceae bacterium]
MDSILFYIAISFLIVFGLAVIVNPTFIWKIEHFFTVKNGEPTDLYLKMSRLGGILLLAISAFCLIASMVNQ